MAATGTGKWHGSNFPQRRGGCCAQIGPVPGDKSTIQALRSVFLGRPRVRNLDSSSTRFATRSGRVWVPSLGLEWQPAGYANAHGFQFSVSIMFVGRSKCGFLRQRVPARCVGELNGADMEESVGAGLPQRIPPPLRLATAALQVDSTGPEPICQPRRCHAPRRRERRRRPNQHANPAETAVTQESGQATGHITRSVKAPARIELLRHFTSCSLHKSAVRVSRALNCALFATAKQR